MAGRSAQHLLLRGVVGAGRGLARAVLLVMPFLVSACLVPWDPPPPPDARNFPPEYDPESVTPDEPAIIFAVPEAQGRNCRIPFSVRVSDPDDGVLQVRWVFDNKKTIVRLDDEREVNLESGTRLVMRSIDTQDLNPPLVGVPHTVSLFVTDATAWAVTQAEIEAGETLESDYGRIVHSSDAGPDGASVVEVRWFFTFQEGACGAK